MKLLATLLFCLPAFAMGHAHAQEQRFNFTSQATPGAIQVTWRAAGGAPLFDAAKGFGFVEHTGALPARPVHVAAIRSTGKGFVISEPSFEAEKNFEKDHYNNYGMAFRIKAAPGAQICARVYAL